MVPAVGLSPGAIFRRRRTWPVPDIRIDDDNDLYFSRVKILPCGLFSHVVQYLSTALGSSAVSDPWC